MLLIDGAKFEEWTPQKEVEEFHPIVKEHIKDIFGEQSFFLEASKLKSEAGKGSIPDGFVIILGEKPEWHILEMELSSHDVYKHVVDQVGRFINGIGSTSTQHKIVEAIYQEIIQNKVLKAEFEEIIGSNEVYKSLNDLISKPPVLTVIIEEKTPELEEALSLLRYSPINIVEFQTFRRAGTESVHAHLFKPLHQTFTPGPYPKPQTPRSPRKTSRITIKDLLENEKIYPSQKIFANYKNRKYEAEILSDGRIKNLSNGNIHNSLSTAATGVTGLSENGWVFWYTLGTDGKSLRLDAIRALLD